MTHFATCSAFYAFSHGVTYTNKLHFALDGATKKCHFPIHRQERRLRLKSAWLTEEYLKPLVVFES